MRAGRQRRDCLCGFLWVFFSSLGGCHIRFGASIPSPRGVKNNHNIVVLISIKITCGAICLLAAVLAAVLAALAAGCWSGCCWNWLSMRQRAAALATRDGGTRNCLSPRWWCCCWTWNQRVLGRRCALERTQHSLNLTSFAYCPIPICVSVCLLCLVVRSREKKTHAAHKTLLGIYFPFSVHSPPRESVVPRDTQPKK